MEYRVLSFYVNDYRLNSEFQSENSAVKAIFKGDMIYVHFSDSDENSPKKKPNKKRPRKDSEDFVPDEVSSSDDAMEQDAVESDEPSTAEESPG